MSPWRPYGPQRPIIIIIIIRVHVRLNEFKVLDTGDLLVACPKLRQGTRPPSRSSLATSPHRSTFCCQKSV